MSTQSELAPEAAGATKLVIVGFIEITPGRRDQLLPLLIAHRDRCLKEEPGTLQFEVLAPQEDDSKLVVHEVYQDATAFDVHRNGSSNSRFREETAGLIAKLSVTKCTPV